MSWEWCPGGAGIAGIRFAFEGGFAMIRTRSGLQEASLLTSVKLLKTSYYVSWVNKPNKARIILEGRLHYFSVRQVPRKPKALLQSALLKRFFIRIVGSQANCLDWQ